MGLSWYILAAWFTIISGIYILFKTMEEASNQNAKREEADRLKSIKLKSTSETILETPLFFVKAFDRTFGERHYTIYCFVMSSIASITAVTIMIIIGILLNLPMHCSDYINFIRLTLIGALMLNLVPDYISLLETRWILNKIIKTSMKRMIGVVILDLIITGIIYAILSGIILFVNNIISGGVVVSHGFTDVELGSFQSHYIAYLKECIFMRDQPGFWMGPVQGNLESPNIYAIKDYLWTGYRPPLYIFFLSTYFTSLWLHLFIISNMNAKIIYSIGNRGNSFMSKLDIDEKPFQSEGLLVMITLTIIFVFYEIISTIVIIE